MNTDDVVAVYEKAARIYCAKIGIDPEQQVPVPSELVIDAMTVRPVWYLYAIELHDLSMRLVSIREAAAPPIQSLNG